MKIAVVSDTHSRTAIVAKALALIATHRVKWILHCGDIEDAETVALFPKNTHFVYGNCDHDQSGIRAAIKKLGATLHEPFGSLVLDETSIAFIHGDDKGLLDDLERSDAFDFLFHGHTHIANEHRTGRTRVINPGALHRARPKSFVIVDLQSREVETVIVE
jgi:putative phosphoesterase